MILPVTTTVTLMKSRQRHSWWFVIVLILLSLISISYLQDDSWEQEMMEWTGFLLTAVCVLGRTYCSVFIGGIKNQVVVRGGPFSIVRNPLYVFSFLGMCGIGLQSGRFSLLLLLVGGFILYYKKVVAREEGFLEQKFGVEYVKYKTEVPRWFPKWSMWYEPEEISVRPYFVRHTMMDALTFFLPWPCFELLQLTQQYGYLPHFITLV